MAHSKRVNYWIGLSLFLLSGSSSWAGIEGSISGVVSDSSEQAKAAITVQLKNLQDRVVSETRTTATGAYQFFAQVGDYIVIAKETDQSSAPQEVHVASSSDSQVNLTLQPVGTPAGELVVEVKAKKKLIQSSTSVSRSEVTEAQIRQMPLGSETSLPRLIASTTAGVVPGPFGQLFIRGNHANIQYQIDGIQMPESPSTTFGQAFSPRNIDHMEVITGGIPAEFGQRLGAVVNIVTKTGPEKPGGELELNYGSYNTFSPHLLYGGSNEKGDFHYYFGLSYNETDRGIDTPNPVDTSDEGQRQGGTESVHNHAVGNNELAKLDWQVDNSNKLSMVLFHSYNHFQIPNYPSRFKPSENYFSSTFEDAFGNVAEEELHDGHVHLKAPIYLYTPSDTDGSQAETNAYVQTVWKHTFKDRSFFQLAPYYKYSAIVNKNDPANDFFSLGVIPGANPTSFSQDRHTDSLGIKGDYTFRPNDFHLFKSGFQVQTSRTSGPFSVGLSPTNFFNSSDPTSGVTESLYVQDDFTIHRGEGNKIENNLVLNAGLRFDATQYSFSDANPTDYQFQPRIGLSYMPQETTKFHLFYGRLFQPAPIENLRGAFTTLNPPAPGEPIPTYDIKAEKDDFYEIGVAQQLFGTQVAVLNLFYKTGTNIIDDGQLFRTPIAQPFNFAEGYAYGVEFGLKGQITKDWSNYMNYSYLVAKAKGPISGGFWAADHPAAPDFQPMDHSQAHTLNAGLTYSKKGFWWTTQALYGSGLWTGEHNDISLPEHLTFDTTVGYEFKLNEGFMGKWKVSLDLLNITDNRFPITIASAFNGSHYAAGRQVFFRLTKFF